MEKSQSPGWGIIFLRNPPVIACGDASPLSQGGLMMRNNSLPCERPIPLVKGKCPEGTKGIGRAKPDVAIRNPRPPCLPLRGRCPRRGGEGRPLPQVTEGSLKLSKYSKTRTPAPKRPGLPLKKRIKMKRTVSCEVYDTKKLLTNPTSNVT